MMAWASVDPRAAAAPTARPAAPSPATAPLSRPGSRLPGTIRPLRYELELTIVPSQEEYQGTVTIPLQIDAPTRVVWLEASDLRIDGAEMVVARDRRSLPVRLMPGTEDLVGLATDGALGPGRATLKVRFTGRMESSRTRGIYRQSDVRQDAQSDWYAYTSFDPQGARRAFPCFDEPGSKTPWHLVLHVRKDDTAVANAPLESEEDEPAGMKVVRFAETPPLPSDLVAFAVGPFELVQGQVVGHHETPFRMVVPRGHQPERAAAYALGATPRLLALLEDSVDIAYPYRKLDVVVTPRAPGAAGHPGLVVVGPMLALTPLPAGEDELERHQGYADTAARALARAWFGGLVTLRSRDEAWLDESLARWLSLAVLDRLEPSWRFSLGARADLHRSVMTLDSGATAQPLRGAGSERGLTALFGAESRPAKGAAILDMIEARIGGDKFQRFLHDHLTVHAYGHATVEEVLRQLGEQAGAEVAGVFGSFIDLPGVPLVSVEARCAAPNQNAPAEAPRLVVSQEPQLPPELTGTSPAGEKPTWRIPLCLKYGAGGEVRRTCTLLDAQKAELPIEALGSDGCPEWVMAQENGHGYYRVRYAPAMLPRLAAASAQLTLPERVALLGDVEAGLARGELKQGDALALVSSFLGPDAELQVIGSTLGLVEVRPELVPPELAPRLVRFFQEAYGPRARALGWQPRPGESEVETQARPRLLRLAALMGDDPQLRAEATRLVKRWLDDHRVLEGDLVPLALAVAARHGDRALQERYLAVAQATPGAASKDPAAAGNNSRVRHQLLAALGAFDDPALVRGALARMLSKELTGHDAGYILIGVSDNWKTRGLAYDFVHQNLDALAERLGPADALPVLELPGRLCDEGHRAEVVSFFTPRAARIEGGARALAQSLESLDRCIAYQKQHLPSVIEFLKRR
jgi:aminopeptidase N